MNRLRTGMRVLLLLAMCAALFATFVPIRPVEAQSIAAERAARLTPGVNITIWFRRPPEESDKHFLNYMTDEDFQLMVAAGIRSVRLPIEPKYLYVGNNPVPDERMLGFVDKAIDRILAAGLAVVIDMHDLDKKPLETDPAYGDGYVQFWENLARHLSTRDPNLLLMEVVNEPVFLDNPRTWYALQERILAAMRKGAPEHTLIASGYGWSSIDGLLQLKPVEDPNVIYTIHFYEPFTFTHQATEWQGGPWPQVRNLPYPVNKAGCDVALVPIQDNEARELVTQYCRENWNTAKIRARIGQAATWANRNSATLYNGEFGVWCEAYPDDRLNYLRDVRTAFEDFGIAWSLWGWDECFGLNRQIVDGAIKYDGATALALGLK